MAASGVTGWGYTPVGFIAKPLSQIAAEMDSGLQQILGNSAGTNADGTIPTQSFAGQLKALIADGFAAMWDLQQAGVASVDPSQATDVAQDVLCSLTGTQRDAQEFSVATGTCVGTPNTILSQTRVATVAGTGSRFDSTSAAVLSALGSWGPSSAYAVGQRVTGFGNAYQCIGAGTSTGVAASGPSGTGLSIIDGTATWMFLGVGLGAADVLFQAEVVGPIGALARQLNTIATPVSGWNAIVNVNDAVVGAIQETNSALRIRRDAELSSTGNTVPDAIRANVLAVNQGSTDPNHKPPTSCQVFFNVLDISDANGVPPHSVEILVQDGTDQDIAQAIWDSIGAGTRTVGNQTSTVTDSQGNPQTVNWTRPTAVPIYVTATANYDSSKWPVGSNAAVAQEVLSALLTFTANGRLPIGNSVRTSPLNAAMMQGAAQLDGNGIAIVPADPGAPPVVGLVEINPLYIGTATGPTGTSTIAIAARQFASFSSLQCVITAQSETP